MTIYNNEFFYEKLSCMNIKDNNKVKEYIEYCLNTTILVENTKYSIKGYHRHHILPRFYFKEYESFENSWNISVLTPEQHYQAHILFYEAISHSNAAHSIYRFNNNETKPWIVHPNLGKTYEEIYGEEKAKEMKEHMSLLRTGKTYIDLYGEETAKEVISKKSLALANKTYEEIHGEERADILRAKRSESTKLQMINTDWDNWIFYGHKEPEAYEAIKVKLRDRLKGKTYEEIHSEEKAKDIKQKLSNLYKGKPRADIIGQEKLDELNELARLRLKDKAYDERYGEERAKEIKEKISKSSIGKFVSDETKNKISAKTKLQMELYKKENSDFFEKRRTSIVESYKKRFDSQCVNTYKITFPDNEEFIIRNPHDNEDFISKLDTSDVNNRFRRLIKFGTHYFRKTKITVEVLE